LERRGGGFGGSPRRGRRFEVKGGGSSYNGLNLNLGKPQKLVLVVLSWRVGVARLAAVGG